MFNNIDELVLWEVRLIHYDIPRIEMVWYFYYISCNVMSTMDTFDIVCRLIYVRLNIPAKSFWL